MEIRFLFLSLVCMAREVLITPLCVVFRRRQREVKSHQFGSALRLWGRRLSPQIWNRTSATCGHHLSLQERKRSSRVCCWIRRRKSQKTSLLLAMQSGRELPVTAGGTQHRLAAGLWSLKRVDNPSQIFPPECNSCCLHAKCVSCPSPSACVFLAPPLSLYVGVILAKYGRMTAKCKAKVVWRQACPLSHQKASNTNQKSFWWSGRNIVKGLCRLVTAIYWWAKKKGNSIKIHH